jgi:hypothetical protein
MSTIQTEDVGSRKRYRPASTEIDVVLDAAKIIINKQDGSSEIEDRRFRELFGCSPLVVLELWKLLLSNLTIEGSPEVVHLLWALTFLKLYTKESTTSRLVGGIDEKTYRKWVWVFVSAIADLEVDVVSNGIVVVLEYRTLLV